jgi:hypothetical protein
MVRSVYQNGTASASPKPPVQNPGSTSLTRSRLAILDKEGLYAIADFDPQYLEGQKLAN